MEQQTHFFFALRLPLEVKEELKDLSDQVKKMFPFSRWVHEQDYHITLAFLGNADKVQLERAKDLIHRQTIDSESFSLKIDHLGVFGRKDFPRIFWAGVQTEERLHIVRKQVFLACKQAGFQLESRPFHPHITLARKWSGDNPFPISQFDDEKILNHPLSFTGSEIVLYQTHLDKTPKYEAIASFPLNSR
jgi:2'-5' RNA ligase